MVTDHTIQMTDANPLPTQDRLHELFDYENGQLIRRVRAGNRMPGTVVGSITQGGYLKVELEGSCYRVHRLIWKWHHGTDPNDLIDHINRDRTDNRIENLREATSSENNQNNQRAADLGGNQRYLDENGNRIYTELGRELKNRRRREITANETAEQREERRRRRRE